MTRQPNHRLRALLGETGWTSERLARAANAVAAESGRMLTYDRTSVAHWLAGSRPRDEVPAYISEALSRRLGRPVTVADAGFGTDPAPGAPRQDGDPATELARITRADLDTAWRAPARGSVFRLGDFTVPEWSARTDRHPPRGGGGSRELDALKLTTAKFAAMGRTFGGGHARPALVAYLATDVVDWLRARSAGKDRAALFDAAARCTDLTGLMCFDSHQHELALKYFRLALRLAAEAGSPDAYSVVLRDMSLLAWSLGHRKQAERLGEAAVTSAEQGDCDRARASAWGNAAVVHAALGHHRKAQSSLATARHFLDEAAEPAANAGPPLYRHAELAFDTSLVLQESGDLDGAVAAVRGAFRHTPPRERYTRATATARLAELWLRTGHVDQACRAIHELLDDHAYLYSARMDATVAELRAHLERHSRDPGVWQVLRRFRRHRGNTRTTPEGAA